MAPNAFLRPFQILALSSALWLRRTVSGVKSWAISPTLVEKRVDLVLGPLHLDDEERLDVKRIARGDEMLAHVNRGPVHELERDGNDAGGDDGGDAGPRRLIGAEAEQHGARAFGRLEQAHGDLGDDAELTFRAHDQSEEVVAGSVEAGAADIDDLAVHQHHADAEHVIGGDPVFQAMGAARIGGDIAADGASDLARRVRRIEEAVRGDRFGNTGIGDAGLDAGDAVGQVD